MALLEYCRKRDYSGFDPYDALNSRLFSLTPFAKSRICRIALTQILKRLPVNVRPLLLISGEQNAKALALFLMAFVKLSRLGMIGREDLEAMADRLAALKSGDAPYRAWGYSFPWQTRTVLVPKGYPNLVCTAFAANALFDAYEETGEGRFSEMALSAARYVLEDLYWTESGGIAGFAYPLPTVRSRVHNANFLGAALLCRAYKNCGGDEEFRKAALRVARYSASMQKEDGSWDYGELSTQRWADNFHTGYNLCALGAVGRYAGTSEFDGVIARGYGFYKDHFFRGDGAPKYFSGRAYPIDVHSVAQSIITCLFFADADLGARRRALSVAGWAFRNLWDPKGHFFRYRRFLPGLTNGISYMRWSQAWMLLALSTLLETA